MITISDRSNTTNGLPVGQFLDILLECSNICSDEIVDVVRIGGVGKQIWERESKIDQGDRVKVSIAQLKQIVSDPSESLEDLLCVADSVTFGLSDSSFLFVQSTDKNLEDQIARRFQNVTLLSDRLLS